MTGFGEIQCPGKSKCIFKQKVLGSEWKGEQILRWHEPHTGTRGKNGTDCSARSFRLWSASLPKYIFLSWQGYSRWISSLPAHTYPGSLEGVVCLTYLTVYVKTKNSLFNQSWGHGTLELYHCRSNPCTQLLMDTITRQLMKNHEGTRWTSRTTDLRL